MDAPLTQSKRTALFLALALVAMAPMRAASSLTVSSTAVTLNGCQSSGGYSQTVQVTASPAVPFGIATTGDPTWGAFFNVSPDQQTTPANLTIGLTKQPTSNAGGTVILTPTDGSGAVTITVTFMAAVNCGPGNTNGAISLSPGTVYLSAAHLADSFQVSTTNTAAISVSVTSSVSGSVNWLSVTSGGSYTISSSSSATVNVQASTSGLPQGTYSGTITASYGSTQVFGNVQLTVGSGGGGSLTLTNMSNGNAGQTIALPFAVTTGGGSPQVSIQVSTSNGSATYYTAAVTTASGGSWLLVDNSLSVGNTPFFSQLLVTLSSAVVQSLAAGTYTGTITVTGEDNSTAVVNVTLTVNGGANTGVTVSPPNFTFTTTQGSTTQQSEAFSVTASSGVSLGSASVTTGNSWLTLSTSGNTSALTVTALATPTGLSTGTYTGNIAVTSTGPGGSATTNIPITIVVNSSSGGNPGTNSAVAPTSLSFAYQAGSGATIGDQFIAVAAPQNGTYSVSGDQPWLVLPSGGTVPGQIQVHINRSTVGSTANTYTGNITITGSDGSTKIVAVTLLVTANPVIDEVSGSAGSVVFFSQNNSQPSPQYIYLGTSDNSATTFTTKASDGWLTAQILSGNSLVVTVYPAGLDSGLYSGSVTLTSSASYANAPLVVPVVLVVNGGTSTGPLTLNPTSMTFSAVAGGAQPASQTLQVGSASTITYSAAATVVTGGTNWLTISPTGAGLTAPGILTVSVNQSGLAAGSYTGKITVITNSSSQSVQVTLSVGNGSGGGSGNIVANPTSLTFNYQTGGDTPAPQGSNITNAVSGTAPISFSVAVATQNGGNWLSTNINPGVTPSTPLLPLSFYVNPSGLAAGTYTGTVTLQPNGGQAVQVAVTLKVTSPATISATPLNLTFTYRAGDSNPASQTVNVSGGGGALAFSAQATSTGGWLSVSPTNGTTPVTGTSAVSASVNAQNLNAGTYTGSITVSGTGGATGSSTITVTLTVTAPLPTITGVANAGSFGTGTFSPGEIVSIFGTNIGPTVPVFLTLASNGKVSTLIGGVQVLFNGTAAPLIYAGATQVNCIVPYAVAGILHPTVLVKYLGQSSNGLLLTTAGSAPAIFTSSASGSGPAAAQNADYSSNSPGNPAAKGSFVTLYLTGEGQTSPAGVDGKVTTVSATPPLTPQPLLPLGALIDNQPVTVLFFGEAPGLVSGVLQVSLQIPANARSGALPVQISIGGVSSQNGVTVSVQ